MPLTVFAWFFITFEVWVQVTGIQINYIKVPMAVKNDSKSAIVLDCDYSLRPDDTYLVVKWYLNDDLVYQWTPPQAPQSFGPLKNKVDLKYRASGDQNSMYRAMKIFNPTTEIAGEYKCFVSTFTDEDFSMKNMIVFVPESAMEITQTSYDHSVNFTCAATEVYPTPKLFMYKDFRDDHHNGKNRLQTVHWDISKTNGGRYNVYIVATERTANLKPGTLIGCELRIPGTGYVKIKSHLFYPVGKAQNVPST
ncbi:unnamed protein product [Callosobruchus maculatus]|uniref:Ig-like domain-containing protein n=1 Tax=Callosobruchus maculatus TaxID=64391 RepID=A0A653CSS5_CALMS|nr:unnamed protein product [Callosobruchus maculatus]